MQLKIYQVDAFTDKLFGGNPAAIVPLTTWLSDEIMQKIASENNLSETAFYTKVASNHYHIRWFTPKTEVALCGHATLATAYVIFNVEKCEGNEIKFDSKSGILKVSKDKNWLTLDFPKQNFAVSPQPEYLIEGIGKTPIEIWKAIDDYLLVYKTQKEIEEISPNFSILKNVAARGIIVTSRAKNKRLDFVSRFFAPALGIDEDPVTGSAHTKLVPYWSEKLGKNTFICEQISERKGLLKCELQGERVLISGKGKLFLKGKIII